MAHPPKESSAGDPRVNEAIAAYLQAREAGEPLDRSAWLAQHAEIAGELGAFLEDLERFSRTAELFDDETIVLGSSTTHSAPIVRFGDYELLEELARGGMGVVYRARQVSLNRTVAVKMILAGQLASDEDVRRFRAEAESAANLQHPHIVAIHEVGCADGQHFFSMEFVEGASLAALAREQPPSPTKAAEFVRTIAEAIAYAHQQGILHRDLKPSNVLIDRAGRVRITDFGLARRIEGGPELTGTGQVLGTPAYMPPEQAAGKRGEVGPASDVYALGAILYELLCGRPPFRAETPLETLVQVLESEPIAPRLLNPSLPRDLETICLKCLQKDPKRRYPTAQALADDLGLFLAGEPIRARPAGTFERAVRWARKQRRSVVVATAAAGLAVLLLGGGWLGSLAYRQWQIGYLSLTSREPMLLAEVLDQNDQLAAPRFTVPTQDPLPLPSGPYRVRFTGASVLSETYQVLVERSERQAFRVQPRPPLWTPVKVPNSYEVVSRDESGRQGSIIVLMSREGLVCLDGASADLARPLWVRRLDSAEPGLRWDWTLDRTQTGRGRYDFRPRLVRPARDLDRDGAPDLVWAGQRQGSLLAISGRNGNILWSFQAPRPASGTVLEDAVLGAPAWHDVDGDGVPDLIATLIQAKRNAGQTLGWKAEPRRWIEAVSGKTGRSLWTRNLDPRGFLAKQLATVPHAARWPRTGEYPGLTAHAGSSDEGPYALHFFSPSGSWDFTHAPYPAEVVSFEGRPLVTCAAGSRLVALDPGTGRPAWPDIGLDGVSSRAPRFADLDGDGRPEALRIHDDPPSTNPVTTPGTLQAVSLLWNKPLWTVPVDVRRSDCAWYEEPPEWPLVADLDGDGRAEVIVAHRDPAQSVYSPWGGLQVLDGATGSLRWRRRLRAKHQQADRITVGPDLDGDGRREVFAATLVSQTGDGVADFSLFVDALSGRDGHALWWRELPLGDASGVCEGIGLGALSWWNAGPDGWPQLVVPYLPSLTDGVPRTFVLAGLDGQVIATAVGVGDARFDDLDGDGFADLHTMRPDDSDRLDRGGTLVAVTSPPPHEWRRLGGVLPPVGDIDGDGVADLVRASGNLTTISGRDGHVLWTAADTGGWASATPAPRGDLDGDGTADLLVLGHSGDSGATVDFRGTWLLQARSGKTGALLWRANLHPTCAGAIQLVDVRDLNGDGRSEVLLVDVHDATSLASNVKQWWATLVSGQDGRVLWEHALSNRLSWSSDFPASYRLEPGAVDVNGDGVLDLVLPALTRKDRFALRTLDGRTGYTLWEHQLPETLSALGSGYVPPVPVVADLDGDRFAEVVLVRRHPPGNAAGAEVVVLDARDATVRWKATVQGVGSEGDGQRPVPFIANLDGNNRRCVALSVPGQLFVWDARGHERLHLEGRPVHSWNGFGGLLCGDLDGEGHDDFAWYDGDLLRGVRGRDGHVLWARPRDARPEEPIGLVSIETGRRLGRGATLVLRTGHALAGLDGATGAPRWRSGPAGSEPVLLNVADPQALPYILDSTSDRTICRLAQPVGAASTAPPGPRRVWRPVHLGPDPRLARRLPFQDGRAAAPEMVLTAAVCFMGLALPYSLVTSAVRRRAWSLRRAMLAPILLGLVFAFFRTLGPETLRGPFEVGTLMGPLMFSHPQATDAVRDPFRLLLIGLQGLPLVVLGFAVVRALHHPASRFAMGFVLVFGAVMALYVSVGLYKDARPASPYWYYTMEGWGWALVFPAYLTGCLLILASLARSILRCLRGLMGRYASESREAD
jgi:predicted Ser/Thr protein kinase